MARGHPLWCLLFVIVLGLQDPSLVRAVLRGDGRFERDNLGGRFEQGSVDNAEVVGDLEIFTRVEEAAGHPHPEPSDASLPHGREVRVRLGAVLVGRTL